jgi:hypothetical protein
MYLADRTYTKDFEWVKVPGANALVGDTEYTLEALGTSSRTTRPGRGSSR